MPEILTETIIVLFMFFLRIGVPIAITLLIGRWLEKRLAPREGSRPAGVEPQITRNGKVIHLHCWEVKRCPPAQRAQCAAFKRPDLPCWLAIQAEGGKVRAECFACSFYRPNEEEEAA